MRSVERRKKILEVLNKNKEISIKDISRILKEKENNIRRDIRILREMSLLTKVYGGIKLSSQIDFIEKNFFNEIDNAMAKSRISKKALEFINEGDSILLGAGTTIFKLAEILYECNIKLNIITLSLPVAMLLVKNNSFNLILIGGKLRRENYSFESSLVEDMLKYFTIDKAFIGVTGFNMEHGFTIQTIEQIASIKAITKLSDEINILVDSSKFFKKGLMKITTFDDVTQKRKVKRIITNKELEKTYIERLEKEGSEVILV